MNMFRLLDIHIGYIQNSISLAIFKILNPVCLILKEAQSKNTMLAISQIEVAVKSFWGDLYHRIPKPEIGSVGSTFAESEVRHADAYSHLLEILGLNSEFKELKKETKYNEKSALSRNST